MKDTFNKFNFVNLTVMCSAFECTEAFYISKAILYKITVPP